MSSAPTQHLFVYGTLRRDSGHELYRLLAQNSTFVGGATLHGRLYLVDAYPGAVPSLSPQDAVRGEVYLLDRPDRVLPKLDEYEEFDSQSPSASLFRREMSRVVLDDGTPLNAWVYLYNKSTEGLPQIPSGDFLRIASGR